MLRTVWLYTPANNLSRMEKAIALPSDCLIFDLEDSIPPAEKERARENIAKVLEDYPQRSLEVGVRINGLGTGFEDEDIKQLVALNLDFLIIPKIESEKDINEIVRKVSEVERRQSDQDKKIGLFCIVETAKGIVNLGNIIFANDRLNGILFGAEDLTLDLGIERSKEGKEFFYARSKTAVYAAAARIEAIDTAFPDLGDTDGLTAEAKEAFKLGYTGKAVIHPSQIKPVRLGFSPSPEKVEIAKRQISEFDKGVKKGLAAVSVEGKMVDFPVYQRAKKIVTLSQSLKERDTKK